MRQIEEWKWRIRWGVRWTSTRAHYTEDEIRAQHPDAMRIPGSRIVLPLPEPEPEVNAAMQPRGDR